MADQPDAKSWRSWPIEERLRKWNGWPSDKSPPFWPCWRRNEEDDPCSWDAVEACPRHEPVQRAAVMYAGRVFSVARPFRHDAAIALAHHELGDEAFTAARPTAEQGFTMADGRFISRKAAYVLAKRSGQLRKPLIGGGILTSEDLW